MPIRRALTIFCAGVVLLSFLLPVAGEAQTNYDYLYYQTKHEKKLFNGAPLGSEAFKIKEQVFKVDDLSTVRILKSMGVKYVIVHNNAYKRGEFTESVDVIGALPDLGRVREYSLVKVFGDDLVYEVK